MVDTLTNTIYAQLNIRYDNTKNRVAGYDVSIEGNTKSMDYIYGELSRAPDVINGVKQNGTRIWRQAGDKRTVPLSPSLVSLSLKRTVPLSLMAFGLVSGAISSLFVSGPIWVIWKRRKAAKA